jgi:adenine-specific DNA-methyltransferase
MSVRYIGSKSRLVEHILPLIGKPKGKNGVFVDAFCGTGVVAEAAASVGWSIRLNDHLASAVIMSRARLVTPNDVPFQKMGGYEAAISSLNRIKGTRGFIWKQYSPASRYCIGIERRYFTENNAARIDGARQAIARWRKADKISPTEELLLLADLLLATNRVANIAGTYGCFLSHWQKQAQEDLLLRPRPLFSRKVHVETTVGEVSDVRASWDDLVYLDPPYTKRQYAAYYHILETIALNDKPSVEGVSGLRPWQEKASDFCYRTRALQALVDLVEKQPAHRVLISYSDAGHISLEPLADALAEFGKVLVIPLMELGRYRPNRAASKAGDIVTEYLIDFKQPICANKKVACA